MDGNELCNSAPWRRLPTAVQLHVLSLLPTNDRALSGRMVCKGAAADASDAAMRTATLSHTLPTHAVPWAVEAGQEHVQQLPFRHKLQLLCTAAASGSVTNLEVALAVLQPSLFPDALQERPSCWKWSDTCSDLGEVAIKAGHPHLLGWLLRHCPASLLLPDRVLTTAATHCSLADLQAAWKEIQASLARTELIEPENTVCSHRRNSIHVSLDQAVLDAAAASVTPDAVAKMEWLLDAGNPNCRLTADTAAAAARSGDLGRLRWLRDQGCPMGGEGQTVLVSALRYADLTVTRWLVDDAECKLPEAAGKGWRRIVQAASWSLLDGVAKLKWLRLRGAPGRLGRGWLDNTALWAVHAGLGDVVHYLLQGKKLHTALQADPGVWQHMATQSRSIPLAESLRQAGLAYTRAAYVGAAKRGDLAMVQWLAREAGVYDAEKPMWDAVILIRRWPEETAADNRSLLQAVQWVYEEAGRRAQAQAKDGEHVAAAPSVALDRIIAMQATLCAMQRGDTALLQYLTEHGVVPVPRDGTARELLTSAVATGCEAAVRWLAQQPGCFDESAPGHLYTCAAGNGDRATLLVLQGLGVRWGRGDSLVSAVRQGCVMPALRWLVERGMEIGDAEALEEALVSAVQGGEMTEEAAFLLRGIAGKPV